MKNIIVMTFLMVCMTGIMAQSSNTIVVPLSNPGEKGKLDVETFRGGITVMGTNRKDVKVTYQSMNGKKLGLEETRGGLKRLVGVGGGLEITENNNNVEIESQGHNKGMNFEIEVPQNFDLELSGYNQGDIMIKNVNGEIVAESYNGGVTAEGISGSMIANTYNGAIKASFTAVKEDSPLSFSNYNREIDLTFPANVKLSPRIKTERGEVFTGFDIDLAPITSKTEKNDEGTVIYVGSWINGKINGGGPELRIETYNGDVYIRKRN